MQKILLLYITCGYRNVALIFFSVWVQIDPSNKDNYKNDSDNKNKNKQTKPK